MVSMSLSGQSRQRQVVILAVGGVLLSGLLLFQVPRTLKMVRGSETAPAPVAPQSPPVSPGTPVTPVSPVAPPTTPTPVRPAPLTRFKSKDPFVQQVNATAPSGEPASAGTSAPASSQPSSQPSSQASSQPSAFRAVESSQGSAAATDEATIEVNGVQEIVNVSTTFPEDSRVFRLTSVGTDTAKVGIARGTLKGGTRTVTLSKGEPVTLLNTADGKRYKLELISIP